MSAWAVKDATETWQDVCDRAWAGEPQFVTRGLSQTVVVISLTSYEQCGLSSASRAHSAKRRLHELMARTPRAEGDAYSFCRRDAYEEDLA